MSSAVTRQIVSDFRSLIDICDVLSSLDIAIGFLSSTGGTSDMLLSDYLARVLRMSQQNSLRSLKVIVTLFTCWLTNSKESEIRLIQNGLL